MAIQESVDSPPLWRPENPQASATYKFLDAVNQRHKLSLKNYEDLYQWSTEHYDDFWRDVWDFTGVVGERGEHVIDMNLAPSENVAWFKDAKVNWAENMLQERSPTKLALIQASASAIPFMIKGFSRANKHAHSRANSRLPSS